MLKKLRLRFVGINMAIVLVILCTIFGVLLHTTHANPLERESVDMITAVAADPLQLNWPDTASRLPYFTVRISPYGSVRVSGTSYYDLSDEQVSLRHRHGGAALRRVSRRCCTTILSAICGQHGAGTSISFLPTYPARTPRCRISGEAVFSSGYAPRRYFSPSAFFFWRAGR